MSRVTSIRLLGPVEVLVDGTAPPPELLWRKHLAVTLLVGAERPRPVSRDRLIGMLWADRPEGSARHSLNEALRVIRRSCGRDAIQSTPDAVAWVAELDVDVDRFRAIADTDPVAAAALIRGPWGEGLVLADAPAFEAWCDGERDRWRGPLVAALADASGVLLDRGDVAGALALAERTLAVHPWSERGALAVMRARALAGDRSGALAAGREHVRVLADDLGAQPSSVIISMLATLQERAHEALSSAPPSREQWTNTTPLIDRERLLAQALEVARTALGGAGGAAVLCLGPTGSGRSRLLAELTERLRLMACALVSVRAVPGDSQSEHGGLEAIADAILRASAAVAGATPEAIATLVALRPAWAEHFPHAATNDQVSLDVALHAVLRAAAEERPVAIVLDDLDRFAPSAIAAMTVMMRELASQPILWVVSAATDGPNAGVDALGRLVGDALAGITICLPPLDHRCAASLTGWAVPEWSAPARDRLARRLLVESAGSLFIAVELLQAIREGWGLPEPPSTWPAADRTLDDTLPAGTPATLTLALRYAFGRLDAEAQQLLQRLAVGPEPFPTARLEAVEPELLDRLERDRWLVSDARGYQIAARGVRRFIAQETLTPGQRRRLAGPPPPSQAGPPA